MVRKSKPVRKRDLGAIRNRPSYDPAHDLLLHKIINDSNLILYQFIPLMFHYREKVLCIISSL